MYIDVNFDDGCDSGSFNEDEKMRSILR